MFTTIKANPSARIKKGKFKKILHFRKMLFNYSIFFISVKLIFLPYKISRRKAKLVTIYYKRKILISNS